MAAGEESLCPRSCLCSHKRPIAGIRQSAQTYATSRQQLPIFQPAVDPYYRVSIDRKFQPLCYIDWPQLPGDQKAVNAMARGVRRHLQVLRSRERTYQQTLRVQRMLACKIGKPECRE